MLITGGQVKEQLIPRLKKQIQDSVGDRSTDTAVSSSTTVTDLIHIGSEPPNNPNMIWFDTSGY